MSKIIEIEELGFPKSLIIRDGALISELIETKDLVNELNEQLRQYNVSGRSEQCCEPTDGFFLGMTCSNCGKPFRKNIK